MSRKSTSPLGPVLRFSLTLPPEAGPYIERSKKPRGIAQDKLSSGFGELVWALLQEDQAGVAKQIHEEYRQRTTWHADLLSKKEAERFSWEFRALEAEAERDELKRAVDRKDKEIERLRRALQKKGAKDREK